MYFYRLNELLLKKHSVNTLYGAEYRTNGGGPRSAISAVPKRTSPCQLPPVELWIGPSSSGTTPQLKTTLGT